MVHRQNVPRDKTSQDKTTSDIGPRTKTSQETKRPKDKTSQGTKRPKGRQNKKHIVLESWPHMLGLIRALNL